MLGSSLVETDAIETARGLLAKAEASASRLLLPRDFVVAPSLDVLIFVEHIARELDIASALAHQLESDSGMRVEIKSYCHNLEATLRQDLGGVASRGPGADHDRIEWL